MFHSIAPTKTQTSPTVRIGQLRRLEIAFWLTALVLGFFHLWADHHYLRNSDAMSYLDIADAYLRGDWQSAVNAYWSPLYSWLLALGFFITKPSAYWKFTIVHVVNFGIYLFALGCFSFLIRQTLSRRESLRTELLTARLMTLPDWAVLGLGYSLFIWSSLFLVTVSLESPDMLVASFVYLACGILLRIRLRPASWWPFILLGIVLGLGYLSKSVMLPIGLVFTFAGVLAVGNLRQALPRISLTVVLMLLIAAPFVVALSRSKGRFTTGESGRLNYLWAINRIRYFHWQGQEPGSGAPKHPTRQIFDAPPAFEFGEPVAGTYPVWYDPTYWYEGAVSHFDVRQHLRVSVEAVKSYYDLFNRWGLQYGLFLSIASLFLMRRPKRRLLRDLNQVRCLLIPAIAGLGLYTLVNVQGRYVASFVVLFWLALLLAVRLDRSVAAAKFIKSISLVLIASMMLTSVGSSSQEAVLTIRQLVTGEDPSKHEQWQVADGLRELGMVPHDKVAFIGDSFRAFWAHLNGLRVIAEVRKDKVASYWAADPKVRAEVIKAFAGAGAKAVVVGYPPPGYDLSGWQKIRHTNYYVYMLNR